MSTSCAKRSASNSCQSPGRPSRRRGPRGRREGRDMASIFIDRQGNPVIQFVAANGRRKSISLAGEKKRTFDKVKGHVEELVSAQKAVRAPYEETSEWLGKIGIQLHKKLCRAGLTIERLD